MVMHVCHSHLVIAIIFGCVTITLKSCSPTELVLENVDVDIDADIDADRAIVIKEVRKPNTELPNSCSYNGMSCSAQGMAIWGDSMFRLFHSGICETIDISNLPTARVVKTCALGLYSPSNHCNCTQVFVDENGRSFLYVSSAQYIAGEQGKCYVEQINNDSFTHVQTISVSSIDLLKNYSGINIICGDDGFLWIFGLNRQGKNMIFLKARRPSFQEEDIVLGNYDVVDYWMDSEFSYDKDITQGGTVHKGYLFAVFGTGSTNRRIAVYNTTSHQKVGDIDLNEMVKEEPEDCDFIGDDLVLVINGGKGFYQISFEIREQGNI